MKLRAEIGGERYEVELVREGRKVSAVVNGRAYELEASEPEPDVVLLKHRGRVIEAWIDRDGADANAFRVDTGENDILVHVSDPKRLAARGAGPDAAGGPAEIRASMPGKVVRVLVNEGDEVARGDGIIVLEAMKMQNELASPKAGTVKKVNASEGDTVAAGQVLASIE
jgi:biotin carboxyl carrier protein